MEEGSDLASPGEMVKAVANVLGVPEPQVVQHDRNLAVAGLRTVGGRGRSAAKMTPRDAANLLISVAASSMVKETIEALREYAGLTVATGQFFLYQPNDNENAEGDSVGSSEKDKRWNLGALSIPELQNLPADHTLADALTGLLAASANGSLVAAIQPIVQASDLNQIFYSRLVEVSFYAPLSRAKVHFFLPTPTDGQVAGFQESKNYGGSELNDQTSSLEDLIDEETARLAKGDLKQTRTFTLKTIIELGKLLKS